MRTLAPKPARTACTHACMDGHKHTHRCCRAPDPCFECMAPAGQTVGGFDANRVQCICAYMHTQVLQAPACNSLFALLSWALAGQTVSEGGFDANRVSNVFYSILFLFRSHGHSQARPSLRVASMPTECPTPPCWAWLPRRTRRARRTTSLRS